MNHPFVFRPGTVDEDIFNIVSTKNEYRLPDRFEADDIVIDIGMHIGSFCYAALQRGSHNVYGFEPQKANYDCAVRNLQLFANHVHLYNKAVWRSDRIGDKLFMTPSPDQSNTGGGTVIWANAQEEVDLMAFDELIWDVTDSGKKRVRMVKIDCEGSEFPILLTSRALHLIDAIHGEFHELGGEYDNLMMPEHIKVPGYNRFTVVELANVLEQAGFHVTTVRYPGSNLGTFYASRTPEICIDTTVPPRTKRRDGPLIRAELLSILACPACESPFLSYLESDVDPALVCNGCGQRYRFEHDIPLLYKDDGFWAPKRRESDGWVSLFKEMGFYETPSFIPDLPFISDEPWATIGRLFKAALLEMDLRGDERILDLGAGEGWAAQRFAEKGCHAVAIDVICDPNVGLSQSWRRMEYSGTVYDLVIGDNERLPFQPNTFDIVFVANALHHSDNIGDLIRNVFRVLRPGGRLIAVGDPITSIFQRESDAPDGERERDHGIIERRRHFYHYLFQIWHAGFRNIHFEDDQTFWKKNAELYPWMDLQRYEIEIHRILGTTALTKLLTYTMLRLPRPFAVALLLCVRNNGLLMISGQKRK